MELSEVDVPQDTVTPHDWLLVSLFASIDRRDAERVVSPEFASFVDSDVTERRFEE